MKESSIKAFDSLHLASAETKADILIKALGPVGAARFFEEFDNGGSGDYTKEKYEQPDFTIDDILSMHSCSGND